MQLDSFDLTNGDRIVIGIFSDNSNDKFKAGIIDESTGTMRSVNSTEGEINHTFRITRQATYVLFIENTSNNDIHVVGTVYTN